MSDRPTRAELRDTELGLSLQEDLERTTLPPEEARVVERAPVREPATPREWMRQNLFSSPFNTILTIVAGILVLWAGYRLLRFVFVSADWTVFKRNTRVYLVGRFPLEELWRVWAAALFLAALSGVTRGASPRPFTWTRRRTLVWAAVVAFAVLVMGYVIDTVTPWFLVLGAIGAFLAGFRAGRAGGAALRRLLFAAWALAFPVVILLLLAFDGVPVRLWGGFLLNLIVAFVAIFASFPLGLFLGLGRRSSLPAISTFCVGFIELIRGVPLYTLLVFGEFVLPLLLPPQMGVPRIMRAMMMMTFFSSAYVAEIVRGGMQGIHHGQYEASRALGLSTTRMMGLIILPQALRSTIPAMISHFISLFKDTSLLAAIAFTDLLRTARRASAATEFQGHAQEALLPAALLFFIIAFSMSRWSQRLETRLGVGER